MTKDAMIMMDTLQRMRTALGDLSEADLQATAESDVFAHAAMKQIANHLEYVLRRGYEARGLCVHDTEPYGTHKLCGRPATCTDERFRYEMCEKHAEQAWGCMDADDAMLANAY